MQTLGAIRQANRSSKTQSDAGTFSDFACKIVHMFHPKHPAEYLLEDHPNKSPAAAIMYFIRVLLSCGFWVLSASSQVENKPRPLFSEEP